MSNNNSNNNNFSYSIPKTSGSNNTAGDGDYCRFCYINFKRFNDLINNICQSCGRVTTSVVKDKQPEEKLISINDPTKNSISTRSISQEMDYNPMFLNDESTQGISSGNVVMKADSLEEAVKLLHMMDSSSRDIKVQNQIKYRTKIFKDKKNKDDVYIEPDNTKRF
jgi:hypothetical protein